MKSYPPFLPLRSRGLVTAQCAKCSPRLISKLDPAVVSVCLEQETLLKQETSRGAFGCIDALILPPISQVDSMAAALNSKDTIFQAIHLPILLYESAPSLVYCTLKIRPLVGPEDKRRLTDSAPYGDVRVTLAGS